jgi:hypothetical protein
MAAIFANTIVEPQIGLLGVLVKGNRVSNHHLKALQPGAGLLKKVN